MMDGGASGGAPPKNCATQLGEECAPSSPSPSPSPSCSALSTALALLAGCATSVCRPSREVPSRAELTVASADAVVAEAGLAEAGLHEPAASKAAERRDEAELVRGGKASRAPICARRSSCCCRCCCRRCRCFSSSSFCCSAAVCASSSRIRLCLAFVLAAVSRRKLATSRRSSDASVERARGASRCRASKSGAARLAAPPTAC